jgi:hypothetical protein
MRCSSWQLAMFFIFVIPNAQNNGCQELDAKMTRKIVASHGN